MKKKRAVIIGGGAAGIFAAICCKEKHPEHDVVVLEKTNQLLSKVRISGGGRCNVTHASFDPQELVKNYPRGSKELLGPFHRFGPTDTIAWFKAHGVTLKTEEDGRMFPITDSSETIIRALVEAAASFGVEICKMVRIEEISDHFAIDKLHADALLLATGSAPWGHKMAAQFGHTITPAVPSLFTFNVPTSPLLDLAGITLPDVTLMLKETGQKQRGSLLLTHWGFSGPAVLKLSAFAARDLHQRNYQATLEINWLNHQSVDETFEALLTKQVPLPTKLKERLLPPLQGLPHKTLRSLAEKLFKDSYKIAGTTTNKQEFVTAGGVNLAEIDFKTMQSRRTPGLFFAGEILNIDGITGGFNFQNAWTTGYIAGSSMLF